MASLPQDPANPEKKKSPSALRSIIAGSTAGAIEIGTCLTPNPRRRSNGDCILMSVDLAITYPAECTS